MSKLLTADQFITALLCALALKGERQVHLAEHKADERFEDAYTELAKRADELGVELNFSLRRNPYHGVSETLRDTLYQVRDRGVVAINNPSFRTVDFKLSNEEAARYLDRSVLKREFVDSMIGRHFGAEGSTIARAHG
jgi:hypothetical protein